MTYKISDIPTHNTVPASTSLVELENPTGGAGGTPQSEYASLAEVLAALQWTISGSDIYRASGKVGFGIIPEWKFHFNVATDQNLGVQTVGVGVNLFAINDAGNAYQPMVIDASNLYINLNTSGKTHFSGKAGVGTTAANPPSRDFALNGTDIYYSLMIGGAEKWIIGAEGSVGNRCVIYNSTLAAYTVTIDPTSNVLSFAAPYIPANLTQTQRDAVASPVSGMVIFNTTTGMLNVYNGTLWLNVLMDMPWYFQAGVDPCMGIPGALFPQNMGNNTDFVAQCAFYTPFILKQPTKFIGANLVTGGTVQAGQHAQMGLYVWDRATSKPTTRLGLIDQAIAANTAYAPDFGSPVILQPGYYAYAFLLTALGGTNTIFSTEYSMDGVWNFSVASNTFKRPMLYSAVGFSALPSPNTSAVTGVASVANGALALTTSSRVANLWRFQQG